MAFAAALVATIFATPAAAAQPFLGVYGGVSTATSDYITETGYYDYSDKNIRTTGAMLGVMGGWKFHNNRLYLAYEYQPARSFDGDAGKFYYVDGGTPSELYRHEMDASRFIFGWDGMIGHGVVRGVLGAYSGVASIGVRTEYANALHYYGYGAVGAPQTLEDDLFGFVFGGRVGLAFEIGAHHAVELGVRYDVTLAEMVMTGFDFYVGYTFAF